MRYLLIILCCLFFSEGKSQDAADLKTNVLFVVDGSSSMMKSWGRETKWVIAKRTLIEIADSLVRNYPNLEFGLRVYGHQSLPVKSNCQDTELKLPIGKNSITTLKSKLDEVSPKGITPVAYTLEQTQFDFAGKKGEKNILILITDGAESCLGDPCAIFAMLIESEIIVKPVVIGLDIPIASLDAYNCVKDVYNPKTEEEFSENILRLVNQSIRFSTFQVNLLHSDGTANQTDLAMLFYEAKSKNLHYNFYHKLHSDGNSDTLLIDPAFSYQIDVQTIPPVKTEVIKPSASKHNVVDIMAPTGDLLIQEIDPNKAIVANPIPAPYLISKAGSEDYFYTQFVGTTQMYLEGSYDIDILTLPPIQLKNVEVKDLQETLIEIPASGKLTFNAKYPVHGSVFQLINNELINIYTFQPNTKQESIDLQPGEYQIIYRFDHKRKMNETVTIPITIESTITKAIKI